MGGACKRASKHLTYLQYRAYNAYNQHPSGASIPDPLAKTPASAGD